MSAVKAEPAGAFEIQYAPSGGDATSAQPSDRAGGGAEPAVAARVADVRRQRDRAAWLLQRLSAGAVALRDARASAAAAAAAAAAAVEDSAAAAAAAVVVAPGESDAEMTALTPSASASAPPVLGTDREQASRSTREVAARETELLLLLVELRVVHRDLHVGAHAANAALEPLKKRLEAGRLEFENLAYEREMLRREITLLQSHKAPDLDALGLAAPHVSSEFAQSNLDLHGKSARPPPALHGDGRVEEPSSRAPSSDTPCSAPASRSSRASEGHAADGVATLSIAGETDDKADPASEAPSELEHAAFLHMLEHELEERRRLSQVVMQIKREHEQVKSLNEIQIKFLQDLPSRIKQVLRAVEPLHSFFDNEHDKSDTTRRQSPLTSKDEAGTLRDFPQPLYVLAREAIAFRDAFDGCLRLELLENEPTDPGKPLVRAKPEHPPLLPERSFSLDRDAYTGDSDIREAATDQPPSTGSVGGEGVGPRRSGEERSDPGGASTTISIGEEETLRLLHAAHSKVVRIHVMDFPEPGRLHRDDPNPAGGASQKRARVDEGMATTHGSTSQLEPIVSLTFRLHPRLGFVTVSCGSAMYPPLTADDLCLLFPCDYGLNSPNLSNAHLLGGTFQFRQEFVPGSGRPYLWANLLCSLHFPGAVEERVDVSTHLPAEFREWCTVAAKYPTHLRFKDVLKAIGRRLEAVCSIRAQLASLSKLQLPLSWQQVGLSKAPSAKLTTFMSCPPDLDNTGLEIAAESSETCTVAWAFHVMHPCGISLAGMLGIQPNYPMTAGIFRLKSVPHASVPVAEADIRDMESEISVYGDKFIRDDKITWDREDRPLIAPTSTSPLQHIHQTNSRDENMILSKQILKLLACVDIVANAMKEPELANTMELEGGKYDEYGKAREAQGAPVVVVGDPILERGGRSLDVVDGIVNSEGNWKEKRGRSTHGRSRSKRYIEGDK